MKFVKFAIFNDVSIIPQEEYNNLLWYSKKEIKKFAYTEYFRKLNSKNLISHK
jgi:hypothetical protein